jgi:CheY-like chemotaxis protein
MDIKMPKLNGIEATKEIKRVRPDLPIIAQTAYAMQEDKEKTLKAGCIDYLSKPIKKGVLISMLNKYL